MYGHIFKLLAVLCDLELLCLFNWHIFSHDLFCIYLSHEEAKLNHLEPDLFKFIVARFSTGCTVHFSPSSAKRTHWISKVSLIPSSFFKGRHIWPLEACTRQAPDILQHIWPENVYVILVKRGLARRPKENTAQQRDVKDELFPSHVEQQLSGHQSTKKAVIEHIVMEEDGELHCFDLTASFDHNILILVGKRMDSHASAVNKKVFAYVNFQYFVAVCRRLNWIGWKCCSTYVSTDISQAN